LRCRRRRGRPPAWRTTAKAWTRPRSARSVGRRAWAPKGGACRIRSPSCPECSGWWPWVDFANQFWPVFTHNFITEFIVFRDILYTKL
jgi:hypothetical protein